MKCKAAATYISHPLSCLHSATSPSHSLTCPRSNASWPVEGSSGNQPESPALPVRHIWMLASVPAPFKSLVATTARYQRCVDGHAVYAIIAE